MLLEKIVAKHTTQALKGAEARIAEVKALAAKTLRTRELEREVRSLRREVGRLDARDSQLVGKSAAMLDGTQLSLADRALLASQGQGLSAAVLD